MKRIFYSSGSIVTGDETAAALLDYARALADREMSDEIDIPVLESSGIAGMAQLVIGPASQMMSVDELVESTNGLPPLTSADIDSAEVLTTLRERAGSLATTQALPIDPADVPEMPDLP